MDIMHTQIVPFEETAELMLSKDYKERFRAEFWQTYHRSNRLAAMLNKWTNGELDFEPTCPREWFETQLDYMNKLLVILHNRAKLENITL